MLAHVRDKEIGVMKEAERLSNLFTWKQADSRDLSCVKANHKHAAERQPTYPSSVAATVDRQRWDRGI